MFRHNRVRLLAACTLLVLALSPAVTQAGTVPTVSEITPLSDQPDTPQLASLVQTAQSQPQEQDPRLGVDRGLEAMGGLAGYAAKRQAALAAQATPTTATATKATTAPHRVEVAIPNQAPAKSAATAGVSTAAAPTPPNAEAVRAHVAPSLLHPRSATKQSISVQPLFTAGSYTLSADRDVFALNETANVTLNLTQNGSPVAGATVRVDYGGPTYTTDTTGQVTFPFTAPAGERIIPLLVTAANAAEQPMGELYAVPKQYGVLVVSDVTDQTGLPVSQFEAYANNDWGYWGRNTSNGRIAMIVPARTNYVEVATHTAPGLFLYQSVGVPELGKAVIHPSGTGTVPLDVEMLMDGSHRDSALFLHNEASPFDTAIGGVAANAYVTPGTYTVVSRAPGNASIPAVALLMQHVAVTSATSMQMPARTTDLARVDIQFFDGNGSPTLPSYLTLKAGQTQIQLDGNAAALLVQPGLYYNVVRYGYDLTTPDKQWDYQFWGNGRSFMVTAAGTAFTLSLGGPVANRWAPWGAFHPNCQIGINPQLTTPAWDTFQPWVSNRGANDWRSVAGLVGLHDPTGTMVAGHNIDTNANDERFWLPSDAKGAWQLTVEYPDLGPYQSGVYQNAWPIQVTVMPKWHLSSSKPMLDSDTTNTVTLTLTNDNGPSAGVDLQVGSYGHFYTDGNGTVTLQIATHGREEIPVWVNTPEWGYQNLGHLYVVPPGYGVLFFNSVQDRNGRAVDWFNAGVSWYDPANGGYSLWSGSLQNADGLVREAGQNYLEGAIPTEGSLTYIYKTVTVADHQWQSVDLNTAGTVPVNVTLTLNGQPEPGFPVRLHNQAMPGPTSWSMSMPPDGLWATPGMYTLQAQAWKDNTQILLTQDAKVDGAAATRMVADTAGLARLRFHMTDSAGNDVGHVPSGTMATPSFTNFLPPQDLLVTPGIPYYVHDYETGMWDNATSTNWHYRFEQPRQNPQTVTPVPGQVVDFNLGGPLQAHLQSTGGATKTDNLVRFETGLQTANRDGVYPEQNGSTVDGSLTITDMQNNTWYSGRISPWQTSVDVPMPPVPGNYTLRLAYETGPYQGTVATTLPLTVTASDPLTLTLSQQSVPVGQPTDVTVTATRNGQPASGIVISFAWYGDQLTDANGQATFHINESWSTVLEVRSWGNNGLTHLFVLQPDEAGVEISGTDTAGNPLSAFTGSAEVHYGSGASKWSSFNGDALVGVITPAGQAYVELFKEGPEAYLLNTVMDVAAGGVYQTILNGAAAATMPFSLTYAGAPLTDGLVSLHSSRSLFPTDESGLYLNSAGQGNFHVTPDSAGYKAMARGRAGAEAIAVQLGVINPAAGACHFDVMRNQLELLGFQPTFQGQPVASGDTAVRLNNGAFRFPATSNNLLATPGAYTVDSLNVMLPQPSGEAWTYETVPDRSLRIDLQPGQPQYFPWVLDNVTASVYARSYSYTPGGTLQFRLKTLLGGQWAVRQMYYKNDFWNTRGAATARISDATGNLVYQQPGDAGYWDNFWHVPAQNASPKYVVEMNRDLGAFGTVGAVGTYTLQAAPQPAASSSGIRLDRELLTVGQTNGVRATLVIDNQAVPNAWVQVQGETVQWRRTDGRGQFTVPIKPTRAGTWTFTYDTPTTYVRAAAYALAPGWGLVDMKVTDELAKPLDTVYMLGVGSGTHATGAHTPSEQTKLIMPAGPVQLVARASKGTGENYYLTTTATVPSMGQIVVDVTAVNAARVVPFLQGTVGDSKSQLYLRNTALPYVEFMPLPAGLQFGKLVYVTPGTYEGLVRVSDPTAFRFLPVSRFSVASGPMTPLFMNAQDANVPLNVQATGSAGQVSDNAELWLAYGSTSAVAPVIGRPIFVAPGTYEVMGGALDLVDNATDTRYSYLFGGHVTLPVSAAQPIQFTLGGPLTAMVQPAQPQVLVNGSVAVHAAAQTANGLALTSTELSNNTTGEPMGWLQNELSVTGTGYSRSYQYSGDTVSVTVGPQPGAYQLQFSTYTGPYGNSPEASATLNALRLVPRR